MRKAACLFAAVMLASVVPGLLGQSGDSGQGGDSKALLLKRLTGEFTPTKLTADRSDVVKPGSIVALQKDGLLVYTVTVPSAPISVYKNGKLSQGFGDTLKVDMVDGMGRDGGSASIPRKTLVAGEKFWVNTIEVGKDAIFVQIVTDPYDDGRYYGILKFLAPKGVFPSPDDAVKMISEVLQAQQAPDQASQPAPAPAPLPPPPPPAAYQDVPPPPPPPAPAPTVSLGMTRDQVVSAFGEPQRKAVLGPKQVFIYTDLKMKVTFTNGKVTNVE